MRTSKHKNPALNGKNTRRKLALTMLEKQLELGKKPEKLNGKTSKVLVDLSDTDKKRIEKDIMILKTRIK